MLKYEQDEILKLGIKVDTKNFVAVHGGLVEISKDTISLFKNLSVLQDLSNSKINLVVF